MTKQHLSLILLAIFLLTGCAQPMLADAGTPTVTPTATATASPKPTATPSATATIKPTRMPPTLTAVPTTTPSPTATKTAVPTQTPTVTPSPTSASACRPAAATSPNAAIPAGPWSRPSASADVIHRGGGAGSTIHLSFDVEGNGQILGALLDVLDKHSVKTTFFIMGSWAEANSSWVVEAAARGHELGNHSYSHTHFRQLTSEQIQAELQQTEEIVVALTGQSTKPWMRPPYGGYSDETVQASFEAGWTTVMWSSGGADTTPGANETSICNALVQDAYPGAILLLHTSHWGVVTAVDRFITEMNAQGYTFVPLSVMLGG